MAGAAPAPSILGFDPMPCNADLHHQRADSHRHDARQNEMKFIHAKPPPWPASPKSSQREVRKFDHRGLQRNPARPAVGSLRSDLLCSVAGRKPVRLGARTERCRSSLEKEEAARPPRLCSRRAVRCSARPSRVPARLVFRIETSRRSFEVASGLLCVTLLAIRRGSLHPVTVGALFRRGHQTLSISFRSCGRAARNCFMARKAGTAPSDCQSQHSSCSPERSSARLPLPTARLHKQP